jgi:hypothetical protein
VIEQPRRKRGTHNQAIGRSRGRLTTKIVALVDALGNLARFVLLPGQRHDSIGTEPLIQDIDLEALIADKAFDNDKLRARLNEHGAIAFIPSKADPKTPIPHDTEMYKWRHLNRELLPAAQGVQAHRDTLRQNRSELRCSHPSRRLLPRTAMNVYRP